MKLRKIWLLFKGRWDIGARVLLEVKTNHALKV